MSAVLAAARRLAARGIPSFPCSCKKEPVCGHGLKDATADDGTLTRLFAPRAAVLVGVPTGPASGLDVLDVDPRHSGHLWLAAQGGRLSDRRAHTTGGGGFHFLFRADGRVRNSEGRIAPGVDVRGAGGYVIWWPSAGCELHQRGPVVPWPEWLLQLALPKPKPIPAAPDRAINPTRVRRLFERLCERVESASPGQRHYALRSAAYTAGGLLGADLSGRHVTTALLHAVVKAGGNDVDQENALATIESGLEKGAAVPLRCA